MSLQTCADPASCRRDALDAIAQQDYERAHDLAWRAMQQARRNDPDLMFVLARAMSLSGRPGDALVMLGRLADLGPVADVTNDPDFARVRALPGWPALEARLKGLPPPALPAPPAGTAPSAPSAPSAPAASAPNAPSASSAPLSLSFSAPALDAFALAHDAVSRRFVLGDRHAHRLLVIDEQSRNVVNYVSAASAGFYDELTAFAIDTRRGDLWVASARGEGSDQASVVHKLQLISGRTLMEVRAPDRAGAVRFVALAVTADGTVYALDAAGRRIFRARAGARSLEEAMKLDGDGHSAMTSNGDHTLYVAGASRVWRVDPGARTSTPVKSAEELAGFQSLAWHAGSLVGVAHTADTYVVVRLKLDGSGGRVVSRQVLASSPTQAIGSVGGDSFYYVADGGTIHRVPLR